MHLWLRSRWPPGLAACPHQAPVRDDRRLAGCPPLRILSRIWPPPGSSTAPVRRSGTVRNRQSLAPPAMRSAQRGCFTRCAMGSGMTRIRSPVIRAATVPARSWRSGLLTAFLRPWRWPPWPVPSGIPARLGFADVRNHLASEKLLARLGTDLFVFHGFTEFWLAGRWVKATPAFNIELCERFGVRPLEFDGRSDALFHEYSADGPRAHGVRGGPGQLRRPAVRADHAGIRGLLRAHPGGRRPGPR